MIEKGIGYKGLWTDLKENINSQNVGAGVVAAIFGLSAGVVHIGAGTSANLPVEFIIMWVTSLYLINGLFGLFVATYYRQPIPMANSIPGALLFAASIPIVGLGPTLGATLIAGVLTVIIGLSGAMGFVMKFTPTPIVLGMIGGVLLRFGLGLVAPMQSDFLPVALMIGAYLIMVKWAPKFPAVVVSLFVGVVWLLVSGTDFSSVSVVMDYPRFTMPQFTLEAFFAYGLPLTVILVGMETPVAVGILKAMGYKNTPANGATVASGLGTMLASFFNLHSTAVAAPMTGICASSEAGKLEGRWISAFVVAVIWIIVAPFYGTLVNLFQIMPPFFVNVIAGLALLRVLSTTIGGALGANTHRIGALFAFLIAASGITLLGIGASFWALILGIGISLFVETKDFDLSKKKDIPACS